MADEKSIFQRAIEISDTDQRDEFLDDACRDDDSMRTRVADLVSQHFESGDFVLELDSAVGNTEDEGNLDSGVEIGTSIGKYRLMEEIGSGGMGMVFVAEQNQPVRRRVALKLIKPGMDSKDVLRRFEAERQALAMMDHPNIARVLDAGQTANGRPYFVMELVKGIPITKFCDQKKLNNRDRLSLFVDICNAIQHAHQKGIIHRDIKPGNVLVSMHDDKPVVKVIDFGVAKAIHQPLVEGTVYTRFTQMIGTPLYMSPEQAEMSGLDIDTRTDIYSLGVLLYELLTGSTPFDRERMKKAAFDEMRRIIREEDPIYPSLRISSLGDTATSVSEQRQTVPRQLSQQMKGELDWIVMKSLNKDRKRRYDSAIDFARDVERYLQGDAVVAAPPSRIYLAKKFIVKHRSIVSAASLIGLALIAGIIGTSWGFFKAEESRKKAVAAQKLEQRRRKQTREALDTLSSNLVEEWLARQPSLTEEHKEFLKQTLESYEDFAAETSDDIDSRIGVASANIRVGQIQKMLGQSKQSKEAYARAIEIYRELSNTNQDDLDLQYKLGAALHSLAVIETRIGNAKEGRAANQEAIVVMDKILEADSNNLEAIRGKALACHSLGRTYYAVEDDENALKEYRRAEKMHEALIEKEPKVDRHRYDVARLQVDLALAAAYLRKNDEARASYVKAIGIIKQLIAKEPNNENYNWVYGVLLNDFGVYYKRIKQYAEAEPYYFEALQVRKKLAEFFPSKIEHQVTLGGSYLNFGNLKRILKKFDESIEWHEQGIALLQTVLDRDEKNVYARKFIRNNYEGLAEAQFLNQEFKESLKSWNAGIKNNHPDFNLNDSGHDTRFPLRRFLVLAHVSDKGEPSAFEISNHMLNVKESYLPEANYYLASIYAQKSRTAKTENKQAEMRNLAIEKLAAALEKKMTGNRVNAIHWTDDAEFHPLKNEPAFQALLEKYPKENKD